MLALILTLFLLLGVIAFFSAGETSITMLNPYRLRHLSKTNKSAQRAMQLLKRPDRLLGLILFGATFTMILTANVFSDIMLHFNLSPFASFMFETVILTIIVLIFGEVCPKTLAAAYPEKIALRVAIIFQLLLFIFYPFVWAINAISNTILRLVGVRAHKKHVHHLSREELKTVVHETSGRIPNSHRDMLMGILNLEDIEVDELMTLRNDMIGLDLNNSWKEIVGQLANTQHTFLPVYKGELDNLIGILHTRSALNLMADQHFSVESLIAALEKPYYIPAGTPLMTQLLNFRQNKRRLALIVTEYGDIQGLITLEDILEEVVGDFTTDMANIAREIHPQEDGTSLVDGSVTLRELNRALNLNLSTESATTLSGLIIDHLQTIPEIGTCCLIDNVPLEVVQVLENRIRTVRVSPPLVSVE
jgi:Mg2+/Co2+ transporter CorB